MERSSNFTGGQPREEEPVCSEADRACRGSTQRGAVPAHSGTAGRCTGSGSGVAPRKSGEKGNFGEKGIFSPHHMEASRADGAATTCRKTKEGGEGQEILAKVSEGFQPSDGDPQRTAHRPDTSIKDGPEGSVKDPNASKRRTSQQSPRTKAGTQARPLVSLEVVTGSGGVAANAAALAEREVDSYVVSARRASGTSSLAERGTPASCAPEVCGCPAAVVEAAPGSSLHSSTTSTTSRKDGVEDASSSQVSSAPCINHQQELATHDEQMLGDPQQLSEKSDAEMSNRSEEDLKVHLLLEVDDRRLPQGKRHERQFVNSEETESKELRATYNISADDKVKGKNEQSVPADFQGALDLTGNEPRLAPHEAPQAALADFAVGERSQSQRKEAEALDGEALFMEFPTDQLHQPRREGAENAFVCCRAVQEKLFFQGKAEEASGDSSTRLPELRQFTLELLYAVSLLRPFGRKCHSSRDRSDCLRPQEALAVDQEEELNALSTAQLVLRSACFGEEQEKGRTTDSLATGEEELQAGKIDRATFDHQRLPDSIPARVHLRQSLGCSAVDDVAALKRRVTDAMLLCTEEKNPGGLSTARVRQLKGIWGAFEGEVSDLSPQIRSDGKDVGDAALATVAFAGERSRRNSFEAFAEKIEASKTTKELVVLLCGYFGPLLHLLQQYMNGSKSKSQPSAKATTKTRLQNTGVCSGDCELYKVAAQAFSQRTQSSLHRQQQLLHEKQLDETVKGVNAILHVLTETDQSAADAALDRVCERLFRSHYNEEPSGSSALDSLGDSTGASWDSEFMEQNGKQREKWYAGQQQRSERISFEYPPSHTADDTRDILFGHAVGEESAACADFWKQKTEQQSRACADGAEAHAFLSLTPTAEGAPSPSGEKKQGGLKAGNDASRAAESGDQTQVAGGGTTISGSGGCREESASYNSSCMSAGEESGHGAATSSAGACPLIPVGFTHGTGQADTAESLVGARQTPDVEREFRGASQLPPQRQQLQERTTLCRAEVEGLGYSLGESGECDESPSSRTAWLAAQLSTPLDILGGDSTRETEGTRNEKVSEEVANISETLEAAAFQPSVLPLEGASAVRTVEKQTAEYVDAPYAWETSVQLVLRLLREQEKQWPLSDAAPASLEDRCLSVRERNPKRRAVLNEREAFEAVHGRALTGEKELHSFVWDTKGDPNKAHEYMAGTPLHVEPSVAESAGGTGQRVKARKCTSSSSTGQEGSSPAADQAAVLGRIAAAAAVERAAVAVAQQSAVAAVEHASVGSAELMRRIRDLGGTPPAELSGPSIPLTSGLAASTCYALRRAVEYVEPSTNDEKDEQLAEKQSNEMFAELDNQGLDSLVSQLLKLAGRPTEQRRGQDVYGEQLLRLLHDMQGQRYPECKQGQQVDYLQSSSQNPLRRHRLEPYQRHRQQHAPWEGNITAGDIVRGGGNFDGSLFSSSSTQHRETDVQSTTAVMVEKTRVSSKVTHVGNSRTTAGPPYLRSSGICHRQEKVVPARMSPGSEKCAGVSRMSSWPPRPSSSGSIRSPLDICGSTESACPSPAGSPCVCRGGKYLSDTPTLSVTRSVGPCHRQSSVKRSPWRSAEPYSSSASTVAASPVAASAQSVGSSSLSSSPFSLLPTSVTTVFQPAGAALESRSPGAAEASTFVGSGGSRLSSGAGAGMIQDLARERMGAIRDSLSHQSSSRLNGSRQRRVSLEGMLPSFGLLPATVPGADSSSTSTTTTTLGGSFGVKVHPGERVTGVENADRTNVTAGSPYAHFRVSDFFDVSASTRAHLFEEAANASAHFVRAFSAVAPAALVTQEAGSGSERRQQQGGPQDVRLQADASAHEASGGPSGRFRSRNAPLSASSEETNQGSTEAASSTKFECARLLPPCLSSSTGGSSLSDSGPSTVPTSGLQSFDSGRPAFREAGTLVDTKHYSTTEQSSSQRIDHRLLVNAESRRCAARPTSGATTVTPARARADQEQHRFGFVTGVAPGQPRAHASASSNERTGRQQQQSSSDAKGFWSKASAPADRGLLRLRCTGGGRLDDRTGSRYCASSPVSPVLTRAGLPGIRREAATVGCVGAGGADCLCGGALCLYRSAVSGVVYDKSGQKWTARWNEDGRQHKRTFAAAKYGFLTAKMKAETCRGEARERTALAKHEALQQQQQSLARRLGLFTAASPAGDGSQSHRCTVAGSSATAAAREVAGQRRTRP